MIRPQAGRLTACVWIGVTKNTTALNRPMMPHAIALHRAEQLFYLQISSATSFSGQPTVFQQMAWGGLSYLFSYRHRTTPYLAIQRTF